MAAERAPGCWCGRNILRHALALMRPSAMAGFSISCASLRWRSLDLGDLAPAGRRDSEGERCAGELLLLASSADMTRLSCMTAAFVA